MDRTKMLEQNLNFLFERMSGQRKQSSERAFQTIIERYLESSACPDKIDDSIE